MRKMRKLISVSLVLSMLCLFTACGTDKKNNANDMAGTGTENNATTDNETAGNNTTEPLPITALPQTTAQTAAEPQQITAPTTMASTTTTT